MRPTFTALLLLIATPLAFARPLGPVADPVGAGTRFAASQQSEDEPRDEERKPGPANLQEAIEIAVKRYGGTATSADTVERDGRQVHEIRLYNEESGSVRTVRIDPQTGAIIPPRRRP
jgi:uncharacterized membrane protein YkoI